jgi:hypothetical protein
LIFVSEIFANSVLEPEERMRCDATRVRSFDGDGLGCAVLCCAERERTRADERAEVSEEQTRQRGRERREQTRRTRQRAERERERSRERKKEGRVRMVSGKRARERGGKKEVVEEEIEE